MTPEDFKEHLEQNHDCFKIWGQYVTDSIVKKLTENLGYDPINSFIKIPPVPRVKEIKSALSKIGRKNYTDPIKQMTDLVGVRFVVLLSEHISTISNIICSEPTWIAVTSKDYEDEIAENPKLFDYQSLHFEVRPKIDINVSNILINTDICCEVQIRTLLQHAYAELVHDNIYKPIGVVPAKAERQVAKSMALMETTDELFCSTMQLLSDANKPRNDLYLDLKNIYRDKIGGEYIDSDEKINFLVLDTFKNLFENNLSASINSLLDTKKYIPIKISQRASSSLIFSQPCVLFIYWAALTHGADLVNNLWPLPGYWRELNIIFSDLDLKPTNA